MRRFVLLGVVALVSASAWAEKRDLDAERLNQALSQLEADPELAGLAPTELARARDAVRRLAEPASNAERAQRVYIADRRVDIAFASARTARLKAQIAELDREHDRILLEASRRDAERARLEAERLRVQTLAREEEAERARQAAEQAEAEREASEQAVAAAMAQADQQRRVAEAQAEEAKLAKREAALAVEAAASLREQMSKLTAERDARGEVMTLGDYAFATGKASLEPEALAHLERVLEFVDRNPTRAIRIEGHTDNRGGEALNQKLSEQRAGAVRDALVAKGVAATRITVVGFGETQPIADNGDAAGRARNRRVDIIVLAP